MSKVMSFKVALLATTLSMLLSSCATIFSGGSPKVTINGNINEPVTIKTAKRVYPNVTLPYRVKVSRRHIDGQRIYIQSETTRYRDVVLQKSINEWTFGNLIFGGLFGWFIDLGTNCVSRPTQTYFYVDAKDALDQPQQQQEYENYDLNVETGVEAP